MAEEKGTEIDLIERLRAIVDEVRLELSSDPRTSVYDVAVVGDGAGARVVGEVSEPDALEALRGRLALIETDAEISDEIVRLPDELRGPSHAIVTAALAPILAAPFVSAAGISQAVLGHHFTVLSERGRWVQVRATDGYVGWVHRGYLHRVDEAGARAWIIGEGRDPCLSLGAELLGNDEEIVARMPWGAYFLRDGDRGKLANGLEGRIVGPVISFADRRETFPATGEAIVRTAAEWTGAPYWWGGVTPAGADCSGFVQAVYRMHGVDLPRDSDQQALAGEPIDLDGDLSGLVPGDLLFFAEEDRRISHVAISLGGSQIVHSSLGNGGVRRNDLDGDKPFEMELRRFLFSSCRVILASSEVRLSSG